MKELENLLTSLIQRGRKPWGIDPENIELFNLDLRRKNIHIWYMDYSTPEEEIYDQEFKTFRELVSLESGLWQFVCGNKLYKQPNEKFRESVSKVWLNIWWFAHNHQYRLLESSLIPEEELGKFLVDNIKLEWLKSEQSKK